MRLKINISDMTNFVTKLAAVAIGGVLVALVIVNEHFMWLIVLASSIIIGSLYLFYSRHLGLMKSSKTKAASRSFMVVAVLGIVGLNLLAVSSKDYSIHQVLASILLCISVYPFWRYLRERERNIPFVPLIAMLYGLYYGIFAFLPFEDNVRLMHTSYLAKTQSLLMTNAGLAVLLITFYKWPRAVWQSWVPQFSIYWSETRATHLAVVFGIVGLTSLTVTKLIEVPLIVAQYVYFLTQLCLLAIVILFFLQLNRKLQFPYKLFLWCVLVPLQLLMDIGNGTLFQPIRSVIILGMTYILVKQRIPWRATVVLLVLAFPLFATKVEFRTLTWQNGVPIQENPIRKGIDYFDLAVSSLRSVDTDSLYVMAEALPQRGNMQSFFAFVIDQTPGVVPYWNGETYSNVLWHFIPRILVPNKPQESLGQENGHRYGLLDPTDFGTSVNLPQIVEMYANFGKVGVIVGMFVLGLIYSVLQHALNHKKAGEWGQVSGIIILSSLINIESNFTMVYGGIIYWILMLWFLGRFVRRESSPLLMQRIPTNSVEAVRK
jgi:hypothetical protein